MKLNKTGGALLLAIALSAPAAFANKDHKAMFKEVDANNDGRITAAEHEAAATTKFSKADANGDGTLTKGELTGFMIDEKGKSARKSAKKSDKKIAMFDANEDGSLSQAEFTEGMKQKFAKADENKDFFVTKEEMEDAHD